MIDLTAAETDALGLLRFADLLDGLPPRMGVDVEVKSSLEDALRPRERTTAALVGRALAGREASRPLLVTSFDAAALMIAREHADRPDGAADLDALPAAQGDPGRRAPRRRRRPAALLLVRRRAGAGPDRAHGGRVRRASRTRRGSRWRPGRRRRRRPSRWSRPGSTASSSTTPTRAPGRPAGASCSVAAARVEIRYQLSNLPGGGAFQPPEAAARESATPRRRLPPRKGGGTATGAGRAHVARPTWRQDAGASADYPLARPCRSARHVALVQLGVGVSSTAATTARSGASTLWAAMYPLFYWMLDALHHA